MKPSTRPLLLCLAALVWIAGCSRTATDSQPQPAGSPPSSAKPTPKVVVGPGEVLFKDHEVKFAVPPGWTVKTNDGAESGALVVLQLTTDNALKPTICLWLGTYDEKLANDLGVTRGVLKIRMAAGGVQAAAADADFTMDMAGALQQTTKNTFLDFKATGSRVVATVMAPSEDNKSATYFSISAAATGAAMGKIKAVADNLATEILKQVNASSVGGGR